MFLIFYKVKGSKKSGGSFSKSLLTNKGEGKKKGHSNEI